MIPADDQTRVVEDASIPLRNEEDTEFDAELARNFGGPLDWLEVHRPKPTVRPGIRVAGLLAE